MIFEKYITENRNFDDINVVQLAKGDYLIEAGSKYKHYEGKKKDTFHVYIHNETNRNDGRYFKLLRGDHKEEGRPDERWNPLRISLVYPLVYEIHNKKWHNQEEFLRVWEYELLDRILRRPIEADKNTTVWKDLCQQYNGFIFGHSNLSKYYIDEATPMPDYANAYPISISRRGIKDYVQ